jgi:predicted PurR-regulated permease PerM
VLVAVVLSAAAGFLAERTPLRYSWSLGIVVVLIIGLGAGAAWLLGSQVAAEAEEFGELVPEVAADVRGYLEDREWGRLLLSQVEGGGDGSADNPEGDGGFPGGGGAAHVMTLLAVLSDVFSYLLVAVFVGLFGAANPRMYTDGVIGLTPPRQRDAMRSLLDALGHTLRKWLVGQGMAMVMIGVSTTLVLWLFGIRLAIVVGLIVGLLGFIPYLGPIVGVLPVVLVAAPEGATTLLWVLAAYTGVQLIEGYGITPLIFERTVYLPPVFTLIMQILLGAVFGLAGIILATPLAAVTLVLSRAYRRFILGDDIGLRPARG